ncbi:54S ribosomal protein L3 [Yarrowia sp. B02]|nr:54S ribosomal protein L3 [Yarrowia sp. B02]
MLRTSRLLRLRAPVLRSGFARAFSSAHKPSTPPQAPLLDPLALKYPNSDLSVSLKDVPKGDTLVPGDVAQQSPALKTLHARLGLPEALPLSTLAQCLTCPEADTVSEDGRKLADNYGMSVFGGSLLKYHVTEKFVVQYPRLPLPILNSLLDSHLSLRSLTRLAESWGVQTDRRSAFERHMAADSLASTLGYLRYRPVEDDAQNAAKEGVFDPYTPRADVRAHQRRQKKNSQHNYDSQVYVYDSGAPEGYERSAARFVQALVAAIHAHVSRDAALKFIDSFILSRAVDVEALFSFNQPHKEIVRVCAREGLERPEARLMAETGRLSKAPVFVVGVFSGKHKLGEGQGASLAEAKIRASVNALKGYYLYSPIEQTRPQDEGYAGTFIDKGPVVI